MGALPPDDWQPVTDTTVVAPPISRADKKRISQREGEMGEWTCILISTVKTGSGYPLFARAGAIFRFFIHVLLWFQSQVPDWDPVVPSRGDEGIGPTSDQSRVSWDFTC